jgi:hypothetical protein
VKGLPVGVVSVCAEHRTLEIDTGREPGLFPDYSIDFATGPFSLGSVLRNESLCQISFLCDLRYYLRKRCLPAARAKHHHAYPDTGEHDGANDHDYEAELGSRDAAITCAMV